VGGTKTQIQQAPTTPAPSASESAADIYQARLQYDPLTAAMEMGLQQQYMPQQAQLYNQLYQQYYPEMARGQQALQQELFPQQAQILEAGAGRALERLASPFGYTPEEEEAIGGIRGRAREQLTRGIRESANIGGGLYGGRRERREAEALTGLEQAFAQEDIGRRLMGGQYAQQAATPYMQILYPQIGQQQPQISPYQFQSAVPSANQLYSAMFQASQPQSFMVPGQPSPWSFGWSGKEGLKLGYG